MDTIQHSKEFILLAFLISLLFHTGTIIYLISYLTINNNDQSLQHKQETLDQEIQNQEDWVKQKARAGIFGAAVFFQEESDQDESSSHETPKTPDQKPLPASPQETSTHDPIAANDTNVNLSTSNETIEKQSIPAKTTKTQRSSRNAFNKQSGSKKKQLARPTTADFCPPIKPPLSLAQLTKGFLHHLNNEGKHALGMHGKQKGIPCDEQIKHERYAQKLLWCLQNSLNIHRERLSPSLIIDNPLEIALTVNKNGSIKHCVVVKSSGNRLFDRFFLSIFNDASTSFPPIPNYIPYDSVTATYYASRYAFGYNE